MREAPSRILIVNYECPPLGGGGGVAALELARGFVELGYEVDYLTSGIKGLPRAEHRHGVAIRRVPAIGRSELSTATLVSLLAFPLTAFPLGARLVRRHEYAFINTHFAVPTGPLGAALARLSGATNVLSLHGGDIYDPTKRLSPHRHGVFRRAVREVISRADVVVAQSQDTRDNARAHYGIEKKIALIPLPYEPTAFPPATRAALGLDPQRRYLVSIGRLIKRKGYEYLLAALAELDPGVESIVIGDGPEREPLKARAAELGVRDRVHFTGYVSAERKFQYLANADLFVLSSIHEGFGIILQEAMQVGLPIVATDHGGQTDIVRPGRNGLLVPPRDAAALAAGIRTVLADDELRGSFAAHNREDLEQFRTVNIARRYLDLVLPPT